MWSLLERTRFAISRLRELELARFGLTIEQASVLHILNTYSGACTLKDIEHVTMRRQHSISCLINGMVNYGLVEKTRNSGEKRFLITLTPAGQKMFKKMTIKSLEDSFSILSDRQRQEFAHCLEVLLERARYLLGISYTPPFMQYLADKEHLDQDIK
jgi:DNA-binding MarR family transcriptional regulator